MCGAFKYRCPNCSSFVLSILDDKWLRERPEILEPASRAHRDRVLATRPRLQALLHESQAQALPTPWLQLRDGPYWPVVEDPLSPIGPLAPAYVEEFLGRWPRGIGERLDRALMNLGRLSETLGATLHLEKGKCEPLLFATNDDEARYVVEALEAAGWVKQHSRPTEVIVRLTPGGWNRVAELQSARLRDPRSPAFVAMWFGDDRQAENTAFMTDLFEQKVRRAIEDAGYRAERVDLVPHNDFVMDKVLGMIRIAPFVVADFTGNRAGVYFEAGFARGLGIPVIHSCRKSHFEVAHFDIKQINTIVWERPEELAEKLYHRIVGTLGPGPYSKEPGD